ncbi:MAG: alternative ribosome rescue aminoacyl-tRNA hydrolase ArfB [Desulfomonilia bacterium]
MIPVTESIYLDESELQWDYIHSSGPGGQNVNKVATAVQLRFDAGRSPALTPEIVKRLRRIAGRKMTLEGVLIITARRFRYQEKNRSDALERLADLIRKAASPPKRRIRTSPSRAAREERLREKKLHAGRKKARKKPAGLPEE